MALIIKPISAILTKDMDLFGKMDPYVVCIVGKERKKTLAHQGGGKKPNWTDTLTFSSQNQLMKVQVYDDDFGRDDFVGEATVNLSPIFGNPNRTENEYVDLYRVGESSGRVLISMEYQAQSMGNGGWGQPQGSNWGQPQGSNWGPPQSNWGPPQSNWGQPQSNWGPPPNSGWNQPQQSNWGPPPNSGWNQGPQSNWGPPPQQNSGWGQQPNSNWSQPPNSGWGQQPTGPVTYIIKPIEANLLKDLDTFSKMDPFVAISIDGNKQRTQTHQSGGKHPKFSDTLSFSSTGTLMQIAVFDEDVMSNDLCGEGSYNLTNARNNLGKSNNEWIDLMSNGKPAGRVHISIMAQGGNQGFGNGWNGW